jgi:hypothetical protein
VQCRAIEYLAWSPLLRNGRIADMSRRQEEKHRKRDRSGGEDELPQEPEGEDELDVAPTDFRRNVWLLVVILAVVALAWIANVVTDLGLFQPASP